LGRSRPALPFVSCVTGTWIRDEEAESVEHWGRVLRQTVRFAAGVKTLIDDPRWALLEIGPGRSLSAAARQQAGPSNKAFALSSMALQEEERSEVEFVMTTLSRLWISGVAVPWERLHESGARGSAEGGTRKTQQPGASGGASPGGARRRVPLP